MLEGLSRDASEDPIVRLPRRPWRERQRQRQNEAEELLMELKCGEVDGSGL